MFTVYILFSKKFNKIYIGYTSNLEARLMSHNHLGTKGYTVKYRPWKVVFTECYDTKHDAMLREKQLKSARGRKYIWGVINGQQ